MSATWSWDSESAEKLNVNNSPSHKSQQHLQKRSRRVKSKSSLTFTPGDGRIPHHVSILDDTGDGFGSVGFDEALIACEEH